MVPCTNDVTVNLTVSYFTNVKEHPKETDPVSYVPSPMHPNLGEAAETVRGYGQAGEVQGKDNLSNRFS
ncbi:hypothetical protein NC652_009682 [Populus alba x Populus x berolinensis]|uniref:Uncharacterized protein n=1 Tax=Populus alba x Populus x berolinensis TaxID=444605 RepID=A0AAD6RAU2_9ROSI|nr:hypothetical protein NC652_009682 [Populus alba x Populus x berolinensis]KAJ7004945.1 hypothetical protein NC653_009690 [Populus alba x Populus x berolinensis]